MAASEDRIDLSPFERGLSLSLGALTASAALTRRRRSSAALLGTAAGILLYRGVSGRSHLYRWLGISRSQVGGTVAICSRVTVQLEPDDVYRRLSDPGGFTLFSNYLESAHRLADERWRVALRTPLGGRHSLEVRRTASEAGLRLAWASVGGNAIPAALELRFAATGNGTEVHADLWFVPTGPAVLSNVLAKAEGSVPLKRAGLSPSQLLEQELRRMRQLLEAGEIATVEGQSAGAGRRRDGGSDRPALVRESR
ncbi:MAG TPA: hypothetical protein VF168_07605 [Trueperaceae bacterium]